MVRVRVRVRVRVSGEGGDGLGGDHPIDDGHAVWPHDHQVRRRPAVPAVVQVCATHHDAACVFKAPHASPSSTGWSPSPARCCYRRGAVADAVAANEEGKINV